MQTIDIASRDSQVWDTFATAPAEIRGIKTTGRMPRDKAAVKSMIEDAMEALRGEGFEEPSSLAANVIRQSYSHYLVRPEQDGETLIAVVTKRTGDVGEVLVRIFPASPEGITIHHINDTYDSLPLAEKHRLSGFGGTVESWVAWLSERAQYGYAVPGDGRK